MRTIWCVVLWGILVRLAVGDPAASNASEGSQVSGQCDLGAGLVAHYPLDQGAEDAGGRGLHAVNRGATPVQKGLIGGALAFDGVDDFVVLPTRATDGLRQFTFSLWIKTDQLESRPRREFWKNPTVLGVASSGPGSGDLGLFLENAKAGYDHGLCGAARDTCFFSTATVGDGEWRHLALTSDGESLVFYVDGAAVEGEVVQYPGRTEAAAEQHARQTAGGAPLAGKSLFLGACNDCAEPASAQYGYRGLIDDLRIWSRALAPGEVASIWTNATGKPPRGAEMSERAKTPEPVEATTVLKSASGLSWQLEKRRSGWSSGVVSLHGKPVDAALVSGMLALRNLVTGEVSWLSAQDGNQIDARTAAFRGSQEIDGTKFAFQTRVALRDDLPAASLTVRWSVDRDLADWEVCVPYCGAGDGDWRCTLYPFAGNAPAVHLERLSYVGVPAALLFRPDLSLVALFGIDPASDYLNPETWTGTTGFHFASGFAPAQYRVGGGALRAGIDYELPLQVFLDDSGDSARAVSRLVRDWIAVNDYKIEPLEVRTPDEALAIFMEGRLASEMWKPGMGYQINDLWQVVYTAESPINAYLDYLLGEQTGAAVWRQRAFETMDFMLKAQHLDPSDPHFGAIDTNYELDNKVFTSRDHTPNLRYKVDMNAFAARYMLMLWERVKAREGLDRREWYDAAVRIADWVVRQQNPDSGLPQVVDDDPQKKSVSVVSGRALVAMPTIHRITGDPKYAKLAADLERFLRENVEAKYWFTGAHVDLWPEDFEADSVWHAVEYWLDKFERTGEAECLARAEADARFAFLMWCPKQLSWVQNPTQTAHTEQVHYLQYSNYCYNNRKFECLARLSKHTGDALFGALCNRVVQSSFWAQAMQGPFRGGQYERICDPWRSVSQEINSKGVIYASELAVDGYLQLIEMGAARARR